MTDAADPLDDAMQDAAPQQGANAPTHGVDHDPLDDAMTDAMTDAPKVPAKFPVHRYTEGVRALEGNQNRQSATSSASGVGQFMPATWAHIMKAYHPDQVKGLTDEQILALRSNPDLQDTAINDLGDENGRIYDAKGIPSTNATKYTAHRFGIATAERFYDADDNAPITSILPAGDADKNADGSYKNPRGVMASNPDLVDKAGNPVTIGSLRAKYAKAFGEDYTPKRLDTEAALKMAAQNLWPNMKDVALGLTTAVLHPGDTWDGITKIAAGVKSKLDNEDHDRSVEEPLDNLWASKKSEWNGTQAILNHLANKPADLALDASTVLAPAGGIARGVGSGVAKIGRSVAAAGERAAAMPGMLAAPLRVAGAATRAAGSGAETVGNAVRTAGAVTGAVGAGLNPLDPLTLVSKSLGAVAPTAYRATVGGQLSPAAEAVVKKATNGAFTNADFVNLSPETRQAFADVFRQKGFTVPAANEAIMRATGLDSIPRSAVTGKAPLPGARDMTASAITDNNAQIGGAAQKLSGVQAADPTNVGRALEEAHVASLNSARGAFEQIKATPGTFGQMLNGQDLNDAIHARLAQAGMPKTGALLARSPSEYPQANAAIRLINDALVKGKTLTSDGGGITPQEIMEVRKQLSGLAEGASRSDIRAMKAVIDGFHDHIEDLGENGQLKGPGYPQASQTFAHDLRAANAGYRQHFDTFEDATGPNAPIASAVKTLKAEQGFDGAGNIAAGGNADVHAAVGNKLTAAMLNPASGKATYGKLIDALGGPKSGGAQSVNRHIRQVALNSEENGLSPVKGIGKHLADPDSVVSRAFEGRPEELANTKLLHASHGVNNSRPSPYSEKESIMRAGMRGALHMGAGLVGSHLFGGHELVGYFMGNALERGREHLSDLRTASHALEGAPKPRHFLANLVRSPVSLRTQIPLHAIQSMESREGHASGGKVDEHEARVNRLMRAAAQAKKDMDARTEPMLKLPDEHVVKALDVAQQAI